jgi:hypothetical protein
VKHTCRIRPRLHRQITLLKKFAQGYARYQYAEGSSVQQSEKERGSPFVYQSRDDQRLHWNHGIGKKYVLPLSTVFEDINYLWHGWNTLPQGSTRHEGPDDEEMHWTTTLYPQVTQRVIQVQRVVQETLTCSLSSPPQRYPVLSKNITTFSLFPNVDPKE